MSMSAISEKSEHPLLLFRPKSREVKHELGQLARHYVAEKSLPLRIRNAQNAEQLPPPKKPSTAVKSILKENARRIEPKSVHNNQSWCRGKTFSEHIRQTIYIWPRRWRWQSDRGNPLFALSLGHRSTRVFNLRRPPLRHFSGIPSGSNSWSLQKFQCSSSAGWRILWFFQR